MAERPKSITLPRAEIPKRGLTISLSPGKALTRVHLDMGPEGITLATAGAASAALSKSNRHHVTLTPSGDGITLAMVGAASAPK